MVDVPPWVGGALFWTTAVFILALAAYYYFTDRKTSFRWLRRLLGMVQDRWAQLWLGWRTWQRTRQLRAAARLLTPAGQESGERRWWPLRWGRLNPEQQVRYLYFQMLDQAAEHDKPRRQSETPAAYAPRLSEEIGAVEEDDAAIHALTDAFVQVRYAGSPAAREEVSWLAQLYERLRRIFSSQQS